MMKFPTYCQAILIALVVVCAVNARVIMKRNIKEEPKQPNVVAATSAAVTPFRRAIPPADADGCPATEMRIKSKSMLIDILQRSMKTKSEELVSFEEKGCKGERCFKSLFTKMTCKCAVRSVPNGGKKLFFCYFLP